MKGLIDELFKNGDDGLKDGINEHHNDHSYKDNHLKRKVMNDSEIEDILIQTHTLKKYTTYDIMYNEVKAEFHLTLKSPPIARLAQNKINQTNHHYFILICTVK